ncbi:MAG: amidohydrolase [Mailhella sp.]|nr:amidohydrolase [Mailhella sp.]
MDFEPSVPAELLIEFRRDFHRHAESGFSEFWTTAFLASRLHEAGGSVKVGEEAICREARMGVPDGETQKARLSSALEQGADPRWLERMDGLTGLIVDIRPDLPLHTVLRFDIDAVDVEESSSPDHIPAREGFRSLNAGHCHACGHDGHAAIGLGVALELLRIKESLRHNVRIIFEPAEEGLRGAVAMVEAGAVDGAKYFFAAHIGVNARKAHELVCGTEGFLASTKFDAEFFGKAAHAGAEPHEGRNSLLAAASAVMNLHAIPRHGKGETRIAVGRMESGSGRNVIPSYAKLVCETRGSSTEVNDWMFEQASRILEHSAAMYEQDFRITRMGGGGTAVSDLAMCELVRRVSRNIPYFHPELVGDMGRGFGADDACAFLDAVQKQGGMGTYAQIGSHLPAGHHSPDFDFDEGLLQPSVELFCRVALELDGMA